MRHHRRDCGRPLTNPHGYRWRASDVDVRTPFTLAPYGCRLERVSRRGKVDRYRVLDCPFRCCGKFQPPFVLLCTGSEWERLPWGRQHRAECPRCRCIVGYVMEQYHIPQKPRCAAVPAASARWLAHAIAADAKLPNYYWWPGAAEERAQAYLRAAHEAAD